MLEAGPLSPPPDLTIDSVASEVEEEVGRRLGPQDTGDEQGRFTRPNILSSGRPSSSRHQHVATSEGKIPASKEKMIPNPVIDATSQVFTISNPTARVYFRFEFAQLLTLYFSLGTFTQS